MKEHAPQLSYNPDRQLTLRLEPGQEGSAWDHPHYRRQIEALTDRPGIEVEQTGRYLNVAIDTPRALDPLFQSRDYHTQADILQSLSRLIPYHNGEEVATDRVLSLEFLSVHGMDAVIYSSLQDRLNRKEGRAEAAIRILDALTDPYYDRALKKDVQISSHYSADGAVSTNFRVVFRATEFKLYQVEEAAEHYLEEVSRVQLVAPEFTTLGQCACLGVDETEIYHRPNQARLYELKPHNIDTPPQAYSLLFGLGALAYEAAQQPSQGNPLAKVKWQGTRVLRKGRWAPSK